MRIAAIDNLLDEPQRFCIRNDPSNFSFQNCMINARKVLAQIDFQNTLGLLHKLLQTANGGVRAFADLIGVAVKNKPAFK